MLQSLKPFNFVMIMKIKIVISTKCNFVHIKHIYENKSFNNRTLILYNERELIKL